MPQGSFNLTEVLFTNGDTAFVGELRKVPDADRLGKFATKWLDDPRPVARQFLFEYLARPLACFRHEALVKRLFKLAEKKQDDELMGAFLVALDRTVRRVRRQRSLYKWDRCKTQADAEAREREWVADGYQITSRSQHRKEWYVNAHKVVDVVIQPNNTMPRPKAKGQYWDNRVAYMDVEVVEKKFVLFGIKTRRYLRRRAWRYFRLLGKRDPRRYHAAATQYLKRYRDADIASDINLLDNWGLVHTLFRDSPALVRPPSGWEFAPGKAITDILPTPYLPDVWIQNPASLLELLLQAPCRAVRQWAIGMIRTHHTDWLTKQPVSVLLSLIESADLDIASVGFDLLASHPDLSSVPVEAWLKLLDGDSFDKLQRLSSLLQKRLDPARVTLDNAIKLTLHRSLPVAKLGLTLLQSKTLSGTDIPELLRLTQAESSSLRPAIATWLRYVLGRTGALRANWLLDFLDSKFAEVRAIGWNWLRESPFKDDPAVWQKLLESPYDDIRGPLIQELSERSKGADPRTLQLLWATVLLNVHRGGRHKPGVVAQLVSQIDQRPDEAEQLFPILSVAVRSLRGPEFRTGLTGVVNLVERRPELTPIIAKQFPELQVT